MPDLRSSIESALQAFASAPLRDASLSLLKTLGYHSDKTIAIEGSQPQAFLELIQTSNPEATFSEEKALFSDWTSADLLFQLSDDDIARAATLFEETEIKPGLLKSYIFFAIELNGASAINGDYARGKLTAIARQLNRVFPMPVMVLLKHHAAGQPVLSIAVINRRQNKRDSHKDVLGKVTIIRDILLADPHRGHKDILDSFAFDNLKHPQKYPILDFDTLHAAWEEIFNVELLNKRFYKELANWYFWALPQVEFPTDLEPDDEKRRATGLIRLLTRLIFCWFLKEKGLIPEKLFHQTDLEKILADFDPDDNDSSSYYHAILQNLFFATLNQRMGKDKKTGKPHRVFAKDEGFLKNKATYDINTLYRYESLFKDDPDTALGHFADIPFLNGGLFECLDRSEEGSNKKLYIDGFSRTPRKRPAVPNKLFFSEKLDGVDLSEVYHDKKRKRESVSGLIRILNRYKFTIVENTPIDQEIALDPELLGKVFENLLASYNEETKTTARKQTGSFYTPRPIVDYMVDESLKAHLAKALTDRAGLKDKDAKAGLDLLFTYTEKEHLFSESEVESLLEAIHSCKILDPACGSGAFPMGMLHKLVYILSKLDPDNTRWQARQIAAAGNIPDPSARDAAIAAIEKDFADNEDDYGRKLYLIESCLYGVDIQPIAIQISKLRFFISLVCDQKTNRDKAKNHGIRPLPNLETRFVAADTLIALKKDVQTELFDSPKIAKIEKELQRVRHDHFSAQTRRKKLDLQHKDKKLRGQLEAELNQSTFADQETSHKLASWDPYDPHVSAEFFEPLWIFDRSLAEGFDVVIQNPPYISHDKVPQSTKLVLKGFASWEPYADIYCFFIERALQLLKPHGISCSITSNSFLRADYGDPLRKLLVSSSTIQSLISVDKSQVFENAIVNIAILQFSKNIHLTGDDDYSACNESWGGRNFEEHIRINSFLAARSRLERGVWALTTKEEDVIIAQIESGGKPLASQNVKIRLGLATGSNDAFLIPSSKRAQLIRDDENNANILKPVIRGRDVDRYAISPINQYLILAKNGVNIPRDFPILGQHLEGFGDKFKSRGAQGEEWWNLRACSFYQDFESDRIVWIEMTNTPRFSICPAGVYMLNTAYFLIPPDGKDAYELVAVLNSSVCGFYMKHTAQTSGMGVTRWFKEHVSQIPLPDLAPEVSGVFSALASFRTKFPEKAAQFLEDLIDACVMECYFREHMAERDLLFHDELAPHLAAYDPESSETNQRDFLTDLHRTLNTPDAKIRNRLLRITADSPDLLAIIKQEGKV